MKKVEEYLEHASECRTLARAAPPSTPSAIGRYGTDVGAACRWLASANSRNNSRRNMQPPPRSEWLCLWMTELPLLTRETGGLSMVGGGGAARPAATCSRPHMREERRSRKRVRHLEGCSKIEMRYREAPTMCGGGPPGCRRRSVGRFRSGALHRPNPETPRTCIASADTVRT